MAPAFFIVLREGLEAALIVGIVAAYLVRVGRADRLGAVWAGVGLALALSVGAGLVVAATIGRLPIVLKDSLEGASGLLAVGVLTWMLFWMRRQGRAMKGELEGRVQVALGDGSSLALAGLAFVAVVREGLETVLFLIAVVSSAGATPSTALGGFAGLAVAVAIGWLIFVGGRRVNLRTFFTTTGLVLVFVSAGLVAFAVKEFGEAGLIANSGTTFDLGAVLPDNGPLGSVLAGLFGYRSSPTPLELAGYLAYLVPVFVLFVRGSGIRLRRAVAVTTLTLTTLGLLLGGCVAASAGGVGSSPTPTPRTIAVAAREFAFDPTTIDATAGRVTFHVTNAGTVEHEFEILGAGDRTIDEVEGLVPGLSIDLTVELAPGTYRYVCRLPGHQAAGMTGTLTVR
jgi:high-affinity iron transporter